MARTHFVNGATRTLTLDGGETLTVRERLNHGERRAMRGRMYRTSQTGDLEVIPEQQGLALVTGYLLDWSLADDDGRQVRIAELPIPDLEQILDSLTTERYDEIERAIAAHVTAQQAERDDEKKSPAGEKAS